MKINFLQRLMLIYQHRKRVPVEKLLAQPLYAEKLKELKSLISITAEYYDVLYLQPLYSFAELVPPFNQVDKNNTTLAVTLDRIIVALKIRRGYMLPLGADAESCYREDEVWTYAVFSAVLLQEAHLILGKPQNKNDDLTLAKKLLGEKPLAWLLAYPQLYSFWLNSISDKKEAHNPLLNILEKAQDASVKQHVSKANNEPRAGWAKQFIHCLQAEFEKNKLFLNQAESFMHLTPEGVFLQMPETASWLAIHCVEIKDQTFTQQETNLEEWILEQFIASGHCIKNAEQNGFLHRYYHGRWDLRKTIKGLMLAPQPFFDAQNMPAMNALLHQEPLL